MPLDPLFVHVQELDAIDELQPTHQVPIGFGADSLGKATLEQLAGFVLDRLPVLRDGDDGRTVLHGDGPPVAELGNDGDFYISSTLTLYGPKIDSAWPGGSALRGLSAYETAVAHGFVGTEAEWVEFISSGGAGYADQAAASAAAANQAKLDTIDARDAAIGAKNTALAARDDALAAAEAATAPVTIDQVTDLQGELDSKADQASVDAVSAALAGKADQANVDTVSAALAGKADQADVDAVSAALAGKAPSVHAHGIDQVTGLQAELDSKADALLVDAALDDKVDVDQVGAANGVASLGADGLVPAAQIPSSPIAKVTGLEDALDNKADTSELGALTTALAGKLDDSQLGAANGVASLGADGKVPAAQLPAAGGGSSDWGAIGGDITDQADLQAALAGKADDGDVTALAATVAGKASQASVDGKEPALAATSAADYYRGDKTFQPLNKAAVGLGNADNTSDANKPVSTAQQTALNAKLDSSQKGAANGVATLDASGLVPAGQLAGLQSSFDAKVNVSSVGAAGGVASLDGTGRVPAAQLPAFVDDVLEYANLAAFPAVGETGKIYLAVNGATAADPTKEYRWSGSVYTEIRPAPGSTDAVAEGGANLYFTEARVRATPATGLADAAGTPAAGDTLLTVLGKLTKRAFTDFAATVLGTAATGLADTAGTPAAADSLLTVLGKVKRALFTDLPATILGTAATGLADTAGTPAAGDTLLTVLGKIRRQVFTDAPLAYAPRLPQIQVVASAATVTPTFADDQVNINAQAQALTLANPTGTAVDGWGISIRIKDNGNARAINYGGQYRALGVTLPTTTVAGKILYLGMIWNDAATKWDVVAVAQEA